MKTLRLCNTQDYPYEVEDLRTFYEALDTNDGYMRIGENTMEVIGNIYEHPDLIGKRR